ncbi:MAG: FAD:protein FMN transferase [Gammaproteobacteria bacterium]|nr:FAD:protein FMN transferase [Gammaproteobacteria bacterium]
MKIIPLLLIICMLFLSACDSEPRARQAKFYAFNTEISISLFDVDEETANSTISVLEQTFSNVNNTWHAWQPSTLTRINEAIASGQSIAIKDDVAQLITLASSLASASHNLFNPAAGKLFSLWGFQQDNWFESHPPPSQQDIDTWLQNIPTMADIHIENGELSSANTAGENWVWCIC